MATISKHYGKWQVQVRIKDCPTRTKSFLLKKDAELWARQTEILIQKDNLGINLAPYPSFIQIIHIIIYTTIYPKIKRVIFRLTHGFIERSSL